MLALAACSQKSPDADDWRLGPRAEGVIIDATLPGPAADSMGTVMGRPIYLITEQALYFPVVVKMQQHVYRYDIAARKGRWQESMPDQPGGTAIPFQSAQLFGSSNVLRQRERMPEPETQPFGQSAIHLEQAETTYSRTYYNLGFPFGDSGWVTRDYGDGTLELRAGTSPSDTTLLLSQSYRADNYPFTAGWSPDGRYVVVLEMLDSASYYRKRKGHAPSLRFAVFGPYAVEQSEAEILAFHARAHEKERQRQLDNRLRRGLIDPEERYGAFYEELLETIQSCSALLAITGSVDTLTLRPEQTLGLSDGKGAEDGKYFTFELQAGRGNGMLQVAAFFPQTPERVRQEIIGQIARYDLSFNDKNHYFDDCERP